MTRIFKETELLIATSNKYKLQEVANYLSHINIKLYDLSSFKLQPPRETGETYYENSLLKAKYYAKHTGLPTLADDSGLEIIDLHGKPGINSADWADKNGDYGVAFDKIHKELIHMKGSPYSIASFTCVLTLFWLDGHYEHFTGQINGSISFPPRGTNNFGYDPIFFPENSHKTFAEMSLVEKQKISHRSAALSQLIKSSFLSS